MLRQTGERIKVLSDTPAAKVFKTLKKFVTNNYSKNKQDSNYAGPAWTPESCFYMARIR